MRHTSLWQNRAIIGTLAMALLLPAALCSCSGEAPDDQGNDTSSSSEVASETSTTDDGSEGVVVTDLGEEQEVVSEVEWEDGVSVNASNIRKEDIPPVPAVPEGRKVDEVKGVVFNAAVRATEGRPVKSVQMMASQLTDLPDGPSKAMWASYLVHMEDGNDIGIEVTCSVFVEPVAKTVTKLRINDSQMYDVVTKEYVPIAESDSQGDDQGQNPNAGNTSVSDDPFSYYGDDGNVHQMTEQSLPKNEFIEVPNSQGKSVWIRNSDLG